MAGHLSPVWFQVTDLQVATGEGCWVTTTDGQRYLDFTSGIAVTSTGHCHPAVVEAIATQAHRLVHGDVNAYRHDQLQRLADRLADITPPGIDTFFFASAGAEAVEAAVKLAKQVTGRPNVVVFQGGFHGRTHLTMAMTTSKGIVRAGYEPLPAGVFVAPYGGYADDPATALGALDQVLATQTAPGETAALVVEPVLGEGGYLPASAAFLQGLAERAARHGILLVADEVQTGFGRTGTMFAVEAAGIEPDVVVLGKGMASGFPMSGIGARMALMERWPVGSHGGTYGGNPMACAAALATIGVLTADGFLAGVRERGEQLRDGLRACQKDDPAISDVRGRGLMVGTAFDDPARAAAVQAWCIEQGRLLLMTAGTNSEVIRWMPPLVVSDKEIDVALDVFHRALLATR